MQWSAFPFVRIVFSLMIGILLYIYGGLYSIYWLALFALFSTIYILFLFFSTPILRRKAGVILGFLGLVIVMLFGVNITHYKTEIHQDTHFANLCDSITYYEAVIDEEVQKKPNYYKAEIVVKRVLCGQTWKEANGRILLYIKPLDGGQEFLLQYGNILLVQGSPQANIPPSNPKQFDFQAYLANQQIYHQHFVTSKQVKILTLLPPNPILNTAIWVRQKANNILSNTIRGRDEYSIVTALVLGIKDNLDNAIRNAYANTGAMHVLAVSGLHVGILFQILTWLFAWVKRNKKYGNWIFLSITLFCLWFYAFITGLSPSVLRAVIMFSMLALANTFQRNTNIYNTIAFSAFLILSYDPYLLFSVSFQLSYLAVLSIIYFYPKLYGMWHIEDTFPTMPLWLFKPINFIWSVTCVSFAAQIGTFPVGLYYFHQFPVYFPLSNLVVIPLATIIFSGGLLIIILAWIPFVGQSIGWFVERIVWFQNEMLFLIEHLPKSVINGIDISLVENWLIYISIVLVAMLFAFRKLNYLIGAFVCIFVIFIVQMQEYIEQKNQSVLYIFNSGKKLNINLLEGVNNTLIADSSLLYNDSQIRNLFYNYWANKGVVPEQVKYLNINDLENSNFLPIYQEEGLILFIYKGKSILWLKTKIANHLPSADYLLISNNAVRNLEKLDFSKFKEIIVDASNSYYNSQKLSSQAQKLGINLYAIHEKGAFIRNW